MWCGVASSQVAAEDLTEKDAPSKSVVLVNAIPKHVEVVATERQHAKEEVQEKDNRKKVVPGFWDAFYASEPVYVNVALKEARMPTTPRPRGDTSRRVAGLENR